MSISTPAVLSLAFIYGLVVGSFLNVVIYRLPRGLNLARPSHSFCPECYTQLSFSALIPIISYLLQRGCCGHCGRHISVQYPLVELITAVITTLIIWQFTISLAALFILLFAYGLICLFMIDAKWQLLPDKLTLPLLWLGLLFNLTGGFVPLSAAVVGAILGYLSLWGIYWVHKLITKSEGMGYGDFKLMATLGAWLGYQALVPIMLGAALLGIIYVLLVVKKNRAFAFGPFLVIMGFLLLLFPSTADLLTFGTN